MRVSESWKRKDEILEEHSWVCMTQKKMSTVLGYGPTKSLKDSVWWEKGHLEHLCRDLWQLIPTKHNNVDQEYFPEKDEGPCGNEALPIKDFKSSYAINIDTFEERVDSIIEKIQRFHIKHKLECAKKDDHTGFLLHTGGLHSINQLRDMLGIGGVL